jgi:hypothetical protein
MKSLIEEIPLPNTENITLSLFYYHKMGSKYTLDSIFNVFITEGAIDCEAITHGCCLESENQTQPPLDLNAERVSKLQWPLEGACNVRGEFVFEHILDIKVPPRFKGKKVSLLATMTHRTGWWKNDWHWEGTSVVVKGDDPIPFKFIVLDENGYKKNYTDTSNASPRHEHDDDY